MGHETLTVAGVARTLQGIVSSEYIWPSEVGHGFSLEFIVHPDGSLLLDFLNQDKAMFWSEYRNEFFEAPILVDGSYLTWQHLKTVGIPFMS